ncbi:glycosyltransferase [Rhizobium sp. FY34]|uniref:glycosyltransferase n=1 Tax=Rhizobium sp. FY34 TaxID=2562309 RepID=UPI0010C10BD2|nr:glycosyltransferase [Rhizobium sp. FY34]
MIIVLTYGKVFTTSLAETLAVSFPGNVYKSHSLQPFFPRLVQDYESVAKVDISGLHKSVSNYELSKRMDLADRRGEVVTFVSGVRDPIARSLSVAMQLYHELFEEPSDWDNSPELIAKRISQQIVDLWQTETVGYDPKRLLAEATVRFHLTWFQQELATPFGFDVFGTEFDKDRGYTIYTNGNKRLLLFRYESGPAAVERGLSELFQNHNFHLSHANSGDEKHTGSIYRELRKCFKMPRATLETIYANPSVTQFYTDEEIRLAVDCWAEDPSPLDVRSVGQLEQTDVTAVKSAQIVKFKATVVIPLFNNAAFIGELLDSIFSQWLPELELLVVDDASTDTGLDIVMQKLATRPDIASTILSHETNCVHATLADIATHARGQIIIQADSDDIMLPGRIEKTLKTFDDNPLCRLVTSNALMISETGIPIGMFDIDPQALVVKRPDDTVRKWGSWWIGATSAFHRSVLTAFETVDPELCPYGFDLLSPLRATLIGTHHHLAEPLVAWRQHRKNSHRLAGTFSNQLQHQERNFAIELMALAQRIRDVEWIRKTRYCVTPEIIEDALNLSQDLFFQKFEIWSRVRNKMAATANGVALNSDGQVGLKPPPGIPAIMTVLPGHKYQMRGGSPISNALATWRGFHTPEEKHIWTSRYAAVALRISSPDVKVLAITLGGSLFFPLQKVSISINFGKPTEVQPPQVGQEVFHIPLDQDSLGSMPWGKDLVVLTIFVPGADAPVNRNPDHPDARVLGVALFALEPVTHLGGLECAE